MSVSHKFGSDQEDLLHQKLAAVLHICQQLNSERDLDALLDLVAREATRLVDADRASIFLLERTADGRAELWSKVALGSIEVLRFDARAGIAGAAAATGEVVNVRDAYSDSRFNKAIDDQTGYQTRTLLAVPLQRLDGEIVGVFEVLNKNSGCFTEEDEEVLKSVAAQAAIAIQTAQFIGQLTRSRNELARENAQLLREVEGRSPARWILGRSAPIQNVLSLIERIRDTSVNVLIGGESGTGKELAARAIHYSSLRARGPFVALNCAALPENLVESELFGIEKGVATGVSARIGQLESASGGTLFLDEIGDLSLTAQAKILRALQERVIERVGGRASIPVDVRVLAATNKDLESEIRSGRFREDLYYRLRVIHLAMPALRDIAEDVPLLARHFLVEFCRDQKLDLAEFSPGLMKALAQYPWPGNVRQLQNEVRRMVACARSRVLTEQDFLEGLPGAPIAVPIPAWTPAPAAAPGPRNLKSAIDDLEREMIRDTLASTGHNQQRTAKLLGLSRQGLINKLKRYGLQPPSAPPA